MKIKYSKTKHKTIEISDREAIRIAIEVLKNKYDMVDRHIDDKGRVIEVIEHHTSHSWDEDEIIRDATPLDIALFQIVKSLNEDLKKD